MALQAVTKGDTVFIGQYLFTGSETTSAWLEVKTKLNIETTLVKVILFLFR